MSLPQLFRSYELLVDKADRAFTAMASGHAEAMKCERHCADCCHAVFGLFFIEAAFLKEHFDNLDKDLIREALPRCNEAERALRRLEVKLRNCGDDPRMQNRVMASERSRCPLLNENDECILYSHRPITCRLYGIPARIQGKARVCWKSGFKAGETYPVFDLDGTHRDLFELSKAFLRELQCEDQAKASLLFSVPKILTTAVEILIREV